MICDTVGLSQQLNEVYMKNNERKNLEKAILMDLNLYVQHDHPWSYGEWKYWNTGGGFSALVWEGADSHIVATDHKDECMAPTTWDHEWMVGHYVGGEYDTTGDLDSGVFIVKGKEAFFDLVRPIIEQDCKQECRRNGGHTDTGRGVCAECGTFL